MGIDINNIVNFEFQDQSGLGFYHFKSEYSIIDEEFKSRIVTGFGTSENKEIAFQKSLFELFERITFFKSSQTLNVKSSSGFAAHYDELIARQNAVNELIERDVFFELWLNKKSPRWFHITSELGHHRSLNTLKMICDSKKFELKIGLAFESSDILVLIGVVIDLNCNFGGFINTTARVDLNSGIDSILFTLSRYLTIIGNRIKNSIPLYQNIDIPSTPTDHFEYYLNPKNFKKMNSLLAAGSALKWTEKYNKIKVQKVECEIIFPVKCFVMHASSNELQLYYSGPTIFEKLNYLNKNNFDPLNLEIHPLP